LKQINLELDMFLLGGPSSQTSSPGLREDDRDAEKHGALPKAWAEPSANKYDVS